ncbi:hypothetical protein [Hydrogenovibrio kuenenii]|uniref:hypothetical protein n=1 Tax=Hydrogenovibrio kuenenii TaxID=63658 RepID=UPI001B7FE3F0|nr:hypothetical protein [Hydrogenovibrio kuenenii]
MSSILPVIDDKKSEKALIYATQLAYFMDIIIQDHSPQNLEHLYENKFLYQTENYSLMCEETDIPWLQFIPNRSLTDVDYAANLYAEIYRVAEYLKSKGLAEHFNVAKIGNKLPYYHIHLVFRKPQDEAWPEAIWCKENLTRNSDMPHKLKELLADFYA